MPRLRLNTRRPKEEGQTLVLVAICLFVLIAMAALAIDVTTLYVARGEMQRAADAAALAAAKAFVDSGVTTAPGTPNPDGSNLQPLATSLATAYVNAVIAQNKVGGVQPRLVGALTPDYSTHPGNPQITVTLERTDVPTFFARIFGQRVVAIRATATAEAYNSSLPPGSAATNMPPVAPQCVKPWIIPNSDPGHGGDSFVDRATGAVVHPGVWTPPAGGGIIGEQINLVNELTDLLSLLHNPPIANPIPPINGVKTLAYLPALLAATSSPCNSCGGNNFQASVGCCDTANADAYACKRTISLGLVDTVVSTQVADTVTGVECLIGAVGPDFGSGQDEIGLGLGAQPPADRFGNFLASNGNDPIEIRADSGPHASHLVTTSGSIVTLPIIDTGTLGVPLPIPLATGDATVIGYMQVFVQAVNPTGSPSGNATLTVTVLNISGCGPNVTGTLPPISGGGISPVPVRLIHN